MHSPERIRPPLTAFTRETAIHKVRMAEDAGNTCDPQRVAAIVVLLPPEPCLPR